MYYKIPDASGISANNIIKNFCFEFKELNSRLFYGNFYLTSITGDFNRPYTNILMEICYLKVCPKLGKCDNRGLPLNGAKKRGWHLPPSTEGFSEDVHKTGRKLFDF